MSLVGVAEMEQEDPELSLRTCTLQLHHLQSNHLGEQPEDQQGKEIHI